MNEYNEKIAAYLRGDMQASEKDLFENELKTNAVLKQEFEIQKSIFKGLERMQAKEELKKGLKKGQLKKNIQNAFVTLVITGLVAAIAFAGYRVLTGNKDHVRFELNEEGTKSWTEADKYLSPQLFQVDPTKDTIIESKGGILFSIPAGSFDGSEKVELEIKEALDAVEIIKAGLSTTSGGALLETGGMFFISPRVNGKAVNIAAGKKIEVSIPKLNPATDMQLFKGVRKGGFISDSEHEMPNATEAEIDWINPQPFKKSLESVDMSQLNFYPKGFLETIQHNGWNSKNKKLTDSIFYAMYCPAAPQQQAQPASPSDSIKRTTRPDNFPPTSSVLINSALVISNATANDNTEASYFAGTKPANCGILPSHIHAIWDKKFNNTIIATKEFEERLRSIYQTCNPAVLQLYVNNLDKDFHQIDSMASLLLNEGANGVFKQYSERKTAGVKIKTEQQKKLQDYFSKKEKEYKEIAEAASAKAREKDRKEIDAYWDKKNAKSETEAIRLSSIIQGEIELNMEEAYRQLGKTKPKVPPFTGNYLKTDLVATGWYNVDKYVVASVVSRTSLDYTDKETGKTAKIAYEPFKLNITDRNSYDRIMVYLLPAQLKSYQKIKETNGAFSENLNELIQYNGLVIAYKGDKQFGIDLGSIKPGERTVSLKSFSDADIKRATNSNPIQDKEILDDLLYNEWETKNDAIAKSRNERLELTNALNPIVFPCWIDNSRYSELNRMP